MSQADLARLVGAKPQTINWLCNPAKNAGTVRTSKHLSAIARVLGVRLEWLQTGEGDPVVSSGMILVSGATEQFHRVPVLTGDVQAMTLIAAGGSVMRASDQVLVVGASRVGPKSFAVKITDSSMAPDLLIGEYAIIDCGRPPTPSDLVQAVANGEPVTRRYRARSGGAFELAANNDDWQLLHSSDPQVKVLGVVVEKRCYMK